MEEQKDLTKGPILSTLLKFTMPFLLANILQTLYGIIDTFIIGNYGSTAGLSAVACGAQLLCIFTFFAIGLSGGGTVLIGQCMGAEDYERARKIVGNLVIDFAIVGIVLMVVALTCSPFFLTLINVPTEAMPQAISYMRICSFGIPLMIGYNIVCAMLRAMGDSKNPMIFIALSCGINIVGDFILTGMLGMGATGVAIATVFAQGCSFVFGLVFLMKKGLAFPFSIKDIRYASTVTASIFRVGIPMGIQSILINISFMFITAIINSMGLTASASMGIGDKIVEFAFMPQVAFSAAVAVIVAQNYGAKQLKRATASVKYALVICFCIELLFLLICQAFPDFFPSLFTDDEEVIKMSGQYMRAYSIDAILTSITFNLSGMMNGLGKTTYNMAQNLIATFAGRIPATWFLSKLPNTNLFLIGCAAPASTVLSIIMLAVYILINKRKIELMEE